MRVDVLAFGAHPDDVELCCSGTLIKLADAGYKTAVVALTCGELGTRGSVEVRASEFARAAEIMGVAYHEALGLPDGFLRANRKQKRKVIRVIRALRPRIVLAPYWSDRHPDHANASKLVTESSFLAGLAKIDSGQDPHRPSRLLYYPSRYEFTPTFIVDISEVHDRKLEALRAYGSQFQSSEEEKETNISHPGFLRAVMTRARQYGSYIGTEYGEPFLVREPMRLDDPVKFFGEGYEYSFL